MTNKQLLAAIENLVSKKMEENRKKLQEIYQKEVSKVFATLITKQDLKGLGLVTKQDVARLRADIHTLSQNIEKYIEVTQIYREKQKLLEEDLDALLAALGFSDN